MYRSILIICLLGVSVAADGPTTDVPDQLRASIAILQRDAMLFEEETRQQIEAYKETRERLAEKGRAEIRATLDQARKLCEGAGLTLDVKPIRCVAKPPKEATRP